MRYALIMLEELVKNPERGGAGDFERAHQEAFLFHFLGVRDALLKELAIRHQVKPTSNNVNTSDLVKARVPIAKQIEALESDEDSWLNLARKLRNSSTHEDSLPMILHHGGDSHRAVLFKDPRTGKIIEKDQIKLFATWLKELVKLVESGRPPESVPG